MDKVSWPVALLVASGAIAFAIIAAADTISMSREREAIAVACIAAGGKAFGRHCDLGAALASEPKP